MDNEPTHDYYADLGVPQTATLSAIKLAFYKLAKEHHPDKSGNDDTFAFRRVHEAYEKLSDASFRAEYDKIYWRSKMNKDLEEQLRRATAAANNERAEPKDWSPPPTPPTKKLWETNTEFQLSKEYQEWQARDAQHLERHPERKEVLYFNRTPQVHGLEVKMAHPAGRQRCLYKSEHWKTQTGGQDFCVFCLAPSTGASRCPGCEALACRKCLDKIIELERNFLGRLG